MSFQVLLRVVLACVLTSLLAHSAPRMKAPNDELTLELPATLAGDIAVERARAKLTAALAPLHSSLVVSVRIDPAARELAADGFALRGATTALAADVLARDPRGAIYGLNELARLVSLRRWKPGSELELLRNPAFETRLCSLHDNPGEERFDTRFRDPAVVLDLGFNGMIVHGIAGLCTFDAFDARIYPADAPERAQVLAARARVKELVTRAKANHLLVFLNGDELSIPKRAVDLYGRAVLSEPEPNGVRPISATKPKSKQLVRATFEEIVKLFPEVDGFQIRMGEVYTQSEPMLVGNVPAKGDDETNRGMSREAKWRSVIETIADVVCRENGKHLNVRVWGYYDSAHAVPEHYRNLTGEIAPSPRLTFSFKQVKTDYWRWNPINPNFGGGKHGQWAEFQMAREYEGKGAFPNYLGRYFADGPTEITPSGGLAAIHARGVRGAWCWARGGGWRGPFLEHEDEVGINVHAFVRLLWDPRDDPARLAEEYGVLELGLAPGSKALAQFVRVQMLSEEAVLVARYIGVVIAKGHFKRGSGWTPDGNWTRDDQLGVDKVTPCAQSFYDFLKLDGTLAAGIAERERALALWKELAAESEKLAVAAPGDARIAKLHTDVLYGQRLFDTASHTYIAGWSAYAWSDGGQRDDELATRARTHLAAAREAWRDYTERVTKLPGAATPYFELGFSEEWAVIENLLADSVAR